MYSKYISSYYKYTYVLVLGCHKPLIRMNHKKMHNFKKTKFADYISLVSYIKFILFNYPFFIFLVNWMCKRENRKLFWESDIAIALRQSLPHDRLYL